MVVSRRLKEAGGFFSFDTRPAGYRGQTLLLLRHAITCSNDSSKVGASPCGLKARKERGWQLASADGAPAHCVTLTGVAQAQWGSGRERPMGE